MMSRRWLWLVFVLLLLAGVSCSGVGDSTDAMTEWIEGSFAAVGGALGGVFDHGADALGNVADFGGDLVAPVTEMFGSAVVEPLVVAPAPTPVPTPTAVPGSWRYVDAVERLVFPTPGPTAAPTKRPAREVARRARATLIPTPVAVAARDVASGLDDLSCEELYRGMLVGYSGRVPFGPEVAWQLSKQVVKARPSCGREGWSPKFGLGVVCEDMRVGGVRMSDFFVRWEGAKEKSPRVLSTRKDVEGNILVHFERMPLEAERGCWYYSAFHRTWFWAVFREGRSVSGVDLPSFPVCERRLRELVLEGVRAGEEVSALSVARLLDAVRLELPEACGSGLWNSFPVDAGHPECPAGVDTGFRRDGSVVLNWHPRYPASDGAVCWVLAPGASEWESFYEEKE